MRKGASSAPFGIEKASLPLLCAFHKDPERVSAARAALPAPECARYAAFGAPEASKPLLCAKRKNSSHAQARVALCEERGRHASRAKPGERKVTQCVAHAGENWRNPRRPACDFECNSERRARNAAFGRPGDRKAKRHEHRERGMASQPRRKRKVCRQPATHGAARANRCSKPQDLETLTWLTKFVKNAALLMLCIT